MFVVILHAVNLKPWRCKLPKSEIVIDTDVRKVPGVLCLINEAEVIRAGTISPKIDSKKWSLQTGFNIVEKGFLLVGLDFGSVRMIKE